MSKKVLIITSSLRNNSNSGEMADAFMKGAVAAGNQVEIISLAGKHIEFCKGCLACQKTKICVINDDTIEIVEKMLNSDVLVFASPIYYYSIAGQLKTMLDRANPLYPSEYKFRDVYFLSCAAEDHEETVVGARTAIEGWVACFAKAKLSGVVFAGGVGAPGEIKDHKALKESYTMGQNV